MAIYRRIGLQLIGSLLSLISSTALAFDPKVIEHEGSTYLVGSVISTPCSIVMSNRYQTV
ncbi:type 1 fimbrial protein, partial [Proteus mirabilis]